MKQSPARATIFIVIVFAVLPVLAAGASTEVHVALYASDGNTILNETTIDYRWMEENLPVMGDGRTHYYLQGPVFVENTADRLNPGEDANVLEKDMGAVKGTDLRDLCDLVGGMEPGDKVILRASDGFSRAFAYENVYEPSAAQGAMVITWYRENQSYVPEYTEGMRLVFFADTSVNPWGVHAMGNTDWHESAEEEYWYYYYEGSEPYPTTTGLSVKYISGIEIMSNREPSGSISVSSEPQGARVYLDDVDTGSDTPCTLGDLAEGFYSVSARKSGFAVPADQQAEVIASRTVSIDFTFIALPQGGGGGSGDGGNDEPAPAPGPADPALEGSQLTMADFLQVNGSITLVPTSTGPFHLTGGTEHALVFNLSPDANRESARLYVFLDEVTGDPGIDTVAGIGVSSRSGRVEPVRSYVEYGADGNDMYAATLVYTLPPGIDCSTINVTSRNAPAWNVSVAGALLVFSSARQGVLSRAWFCEGADLVGPALIQETAMTQAEFGIIPLPPHGGVNATLHVATTPALGPGNLTFLVNGVSMSPVPAEGPGSLPTIGGIELTGNESVSLHIASQGVPVTNRVAILVVATPLPEPGQDYSGMNATVIRRYVIPTSSPPVSQETPSPPPLVEDSERGDGSIPGTILRWFVNLLVIIGGGSADEGMIQAPVDVPAGGEPGPLPQPLKHPVVVPVISSPVGAEVFIDGKTTGLATPCEIELVPGDMHTVRIAKEGYRAIDLQLGEKPVTVTLERIATSPAISETIPGPASHTHHGGVSISTYPEKAEIRIDGVAVGTDSPVLVYPLKEGFHTITAGIRAGERGYTAKESVRTWIFSDALVAVDFNLMDTERSEKVNITGESRHGDPFTASGYYPVKRVPDIVEFAGSPPFVTLTGNMTFLSFPVSRESLESGTFSLPGKDPLVCTLVVESEPEGSEIFIDGIRTGLVTPASIRNVSAGYHRLMVVSSGRVPVTELIHIAESDCMRGEVVRARYKTDWYPSGSIALVSDPPGASVLIRGLKTGETTPCRIDNIPIGVWEVTFSSGKLKKAIDVNVEPGGNRTYSVVMD